MARSTTIRSSVGFGRTWFADADDSGFSLVEALVSFTLFIVLAASATLALVNTLQLTSVSRDRVTASRLASQEIEMLREDNSTSHLSAAHTLIDVNGNPFTVPADGVAHTLTEHNVAYSVTATLNPGAAATCNTGYSRTINVVVTWIANATTRSTTYNSVIAC